MTGLYNRLYYSLFKLQLGIARAFEMETDTPRTSAVLTLALFITIKVLAFLGVLSVLLGSPLFIGSMLGVIVVAAGIILISFFYIFQNKHYQTIEHQMAVKWQQEKVWNIALTISYVLFTIIILFVSIKYIKSHHLRS